MKELERLANDLQVIEEANDHIETQCKKCGYVFEQKKPKTLCYHCYIKKTHKALFSESAHPKSDDEAHSAFDALGYK
jgi:predicted Zn-ribbon and HTH transcriptional regulator